MGHTIQLGDAQIDEARLADLCRHYGVYHQRYDGPPRQQVQISA